MTAKASYEIRDARFVSPTAVRLEARFVDASGKVFTHDDPTKEKHDPEWEEIFINPFVSEADLHRQLADVLQHKIAARQVGEPLVLTAHTVEVDVE